jgi:acylphosphatase
MKSQNSQKIQILVSGRVQGVGFRRFVQKNAQSLRLRGWTRNLWDGRVQIIAEGLSADLDLLCEKLKSGHAFAHVEDLKVSETNETLNSIEFVILPDGETV